MRTRRLAVTAIGVLAALTTAACSSSGSGSSGSATSSSASPVSASGSAASSSASTAQTKPLVIDAISSLSGPLAAVGSSQQEGAKAAVAVINAQGGVFGQPIQYNVTDDKSDPTQAVSAVTKILSGSTKPAAVIPGSTSTDTSAVVPLLTKAKIFTPNHSSDDTVNDPTKNPYAFQDVFTSDDQAENLAAKFQSKGYKKVAVIDSDDARGQGALASYKKVFASKGFQVNTVAVPDTSVDATPQVQQLMADKPDVLLVNNFAPTASAVVKAVNKLGLSIPIYGSQTFAANDIGALGGAAAIKGWQLQALALAVKGTPITKGSAFQTFMNQLKKQGTKITFTINNYVVAYNDVILAATAAKIADSTDPDKMKAAAESLTPAKAPLYVGPLGFSATSHQPATTSQYWVYTTYGSLTDGQIVPAS